MADLGLRPRRILLTTDPIGGVWQYGMELARGLARHGVGIVLAGMGGGISPAQREEALAVPGLVLMESDLRLEWMPHAERDFRRAADWLLDLEARFLPDLVHLNGYSHAALDWQAPVVVAAHSCVLSWWLAVKGGPVPPEWWTYRRAVTAGLCAADLCVAPSEAMAVMVRRLYGPDLPMRVIWNGRDPERFAPRPKQNLILSVGRLWDEAKNIAALEAVARELEWPVALAGPWQRPDGSGVLPRGMACLGLLGEEAMRYSYGSAAIYAHPAKYEPFGLSVLEAALSECALVLGDIPTMRELWSGCAEFVAPDDHRALRSTLSRLIANPSHRGRLAKAARRRAQLYASDRMIAEYLGAYASVLSARPLAALDRPMALERAQYGTGG